jgi:hypothetical protein|tara:strand:+ start:727 stop:1185 length:459 start_codon:yes stop_codon:yes gene_type:complete
MDTSSSSDNSDKLAANAHRTQIGDGSIKQAVNAHRAQMSDGSTTGSTTGSTDMTGGKSRRRSRSRSASRSASRSRGRARSASRSRGRGKSASRGRRARRAGMGCSKKGGSYGALVKEAIVPFGIFAWQKKSQRKKGSKKTFRKNRKSRRYKR